MDHHQPPNQPNLSSNTQSSSHKQTFAAMTSQNVFPRKDQAIILNTIDGVPQKTYLIELSKIIQPSNIIFASRISKGRYCIYLSKKELVDQLIHNNQHITIDDQIVKLRRLHNPDKRIILSNVFPNIPNSPILEQLSEHNIIPTSPISFLRAGSIANGLDHVLSFRRQMFISHDDFERLPKSMLINHDSSYYRIFLEDDKVTCFICKEKGHTSTVCPMNTDKSLPTDTICETPMDLDTETNKHSLSSTANHSPLTAVPNVKITGSGSCTDNPVEKDKPTTPNLTILQSASEEISLTGGIKRPAPSTLSSSASPPQSPTIHTIPPTIIKSNQVCNKKTEENTTTSTLKKKLKSSADHFIDTIDDHLSPCKPVFNVTKDIPINYEQFKLLLVNCINSNNPREECVPFNMCATNMLIIIDLIRPKITSLSGKNRLTRIHKAFFNTLSDKELSNYESHDNKNPFN